MKPFDTLSHLGKGRRLLPLVRKILRRYRIEDALLSQVRESVNLVFRLRTTDDERFVLRLTPPWHFHGVSDVRSEICWLQAIARETEIGVPGTVADIEGHRVIRATWPEHPGAWHCVLFTWLPGTVLANRWSARSIERFGRLSARLHAHGSGFASPAGFRIRVAASVFSHCEPGFEHPEPLVLFGRRVANLMPPPRRDLLRRVQERAQSEIDLLFATGKPQPIHNDLHPWNVMVSGRQLYALDFENCLLGFPVQDVGTTLHYIEQHFSQTIPFERCLEYFRRGYECERAWPEEHPGQIEAMTAAHRLLLCNFYAASNDPEYREFAVGFIERMEPRLRKFLDRA